MHNILPITQRVFAKTLSLDMVEVKPMSAPTGKLFYADYVYESRKNINRKNKIKNIFNESD